MRRLFKFSEGVCRGREGGTPSAARLSRRRWAAAQFRAGQCRRVSSRDLENPSRNAPSWWEGFSSSEIDYAIKNCGANWNEQALLKAKNYLEYSAFSESGLKDQLDYEGFSSSQVDYGVKNCGANWNEQAAKKAEDYMDTMDFSKQGLIDQLLFEGFTEAQAEYGAESVGF